MVKLKMPANYLRNDPIWEVKILEIIHKLLREKAPDLSESTTETFIQKFETENIQQFINILLRFDNYYAETYPFSSLINDELEIDEARFNEFRDFFLPFIRLEPSLSEGKRHLHFDEVAAFPLWQQRHHDRFISTSNPTEFAGIPQTYNLGQLSSKDYWLTDYDMVSFLEANELQNKIQIINFDEAAINLALRQAHSQSNGESYTALFLIKHPNQGGKDGTSSLWSHMAVTINPKKEKLTVDYVYPQGISEDQRTALKEKIKNAIAYRGASLHKKQAKFADFKETQINVEGISGPVTNRESGLYALEALSKKADKNIKFPDSFLNLQKIILNYLKEQYPGKLQRPSEKEETILNRLVKKYIKEFDQLESTNPEFKNKSEISFINFYNYDIRKVSDPLERKALLQALFSKLEEQGNNQIIVSNFNDLNTDIQALILQLIDDVALSPNYIFEGCSDEVTDKLNIIAARNQFAYNISIYLTNVPTAISEWDYQAARWLYNRENNPFKSFHYFDRGSQENNTHLTTMGTTFFAKVLSYISSHQNSTARLPYEVFLLDFRQAPDVNITDFLALLVNYLEQADTYFPFSTLSIEINPEELPSVLPFLEHLLKAAHKHKIKQLEIKHANNELNLSEQQFHAIKTIVVEHNITTQLIFPNNNDQKLLEIQNVINHHVQVRNINSLTLIADEAAEPALRESVSLDFRMPVQLPKKKFLQGRNARQYLQLQVEKQQQAQASVQTQTSVQKQVFTQEAAEQSYPISDHVKTLYEDQFVKGYQKFTSVNLSALWKTLFAIIEKRSLSTITHEAALQLVQYAPYFADGYNRFNLPAGFFQAKGFFSSILCFDVNYHRPNAATPLTLTLREPLVPDVILGDSRLFGDTDDNVIIFQHNIFNEGIDQETARGCLLRWIGNLSANEAAVLETLEKPSLEILARVLYTHGDPGIHKVFNWLNKLKIENPAIFDSYSTHIFPHLNHHEYLFSEDMQKTIEGFAKFTPPQTRWWQALIEFNQLPMNELLLIDLYLGVQYFFDELKARNLVLPDSFPERIMVKGREPKVVLLLLDHILRLLDHVQDPQTQLDNLSGLSIDDANAVYVTSDASTYRNPYRLVTEEMHIKVGAPGIFDTIYFWQEQDRGISYGLDSQHAHKDYFTRFATSAEFDFGLYNSPYDYLLSMLPTVNIGYVKESALSDLMRYSGLQLMNFANQDFFDGIRFAQQYPKATHAIIRTKQGYAYFDKDHRFLKSLALDNEAIAAMDAALMVNPTDVWKPEFLNLYSSRPLDEKTFNEAPPALRDKLLPSLREYRHAREQLRISHQPIMRSQIVEAVSKKLKMQFFRLLGRLKKHQGIYVYRQIMHDIEALPYNNERTLTANAEFKGGLICLLAQSIIAQKVSKANARNEFNRFIQLLSEYDEDTQLFIIQQLTKRIGKRSYDVHKPLLSLSSYCTLLEFLKESSAQDFIDNLTFLVDCSVKWDSYHSYSFGVSMREHFLGALSALMKNDQGLTKTEFLNAIKLWLKQQKYSQEVEVVEILSKINRQDFTTENCQAFFDVLRTLVIQESKYREDKKTRERALGILRTLTAEHKPTIKELTTALVAVRDLALPTYDNILTTLKMALPNCQFHTTTNYFWKKEDDKKLSEYFNKTLQDFLRNDESFQRAFIAVELTIEDLLSPEKLSENTQKVARLAENFPNEAGQLLALLINSAKLNILNAIENDSQIKWLERQHAIELVNNRLFKGLEIPSVENILKVMEFSLHFQAFLYSLVKLERKRENKNFLAHFAEYATFENFSLSDLAKFLTTLDMHMPQNENIEPLLRAIFLLPIKQRQPEDMSRFFQQVSRFAELFPNAQALILVAEVLAKSDGNLGRIYNLISEEHAELREALLKNLHRLVDNDVSISDINDAWHIFVDSNQALQSSLKLKFCSLQFLPRVVAEKLALLPKNLLPIVETIGFSQIKTIKDEQALANFIERLCLLSNDDLEVLSRLSETAPYPGSQLILDYLESHESLAEFEQHFTSDPFGTRNTEVQFNAGRVKEYIAEMFDYRFSAENVLLSKDDQRLLYQHFTYVNTIGYDLPIPVVNTEVKVISLMSTAEIRRLMAQYKNSLQQVELSDNDKLTIKLRALALAREVMYRTTGLFPNVTQMLTVLYALEHDDKSIISQINTGEGKSVIVSLYAFMLTLEGQSVDICTANKALAKRDIDNFKDFFNYFGVKTAKISALSPFEKYCENGINYSTVAEMAIYRSRAELEQVKRIAPQVLVADEVDFSLKDRTVYRFAANLDALNDVKNNPYAFIYDVIINFVDHSGKFNIDEDVSANVQRLLEYTQTYCSVKERGVLAGCFGDKLPLQLCLWIESCLAAKELEENVDYKTCDVEDEPGKKVNRILIDTRISDESVYSYGVQQFLNAYSNRKYEREHHTRPFSIEPELYTVTSSTSKNFFSSYRKFFGVTGTIGSAAYRQELLTHSDLHMVRVPPKNSSIRKDLPTEIVPDKIDRLVALVQNGEPTLIICENINKAKEISLRLRQAINDDSRFALCISGETTKAQEVDIVSKIGEPGRITISTTMLARGVDSEPRQVVAAFAPDEVEMAQIFGRTGRHGAEGTAMMIMDREDLENTFQNVPPEIPPHEVESTLKRLREEKALLLKKEREQRELFGDLIKVIENKFIALEQFLNLSTEERNHFRKGWAEFNKQHHQLWADLDLDHSNERISEFNEALIENWNAFVMGILRVPDAQYICTQAELAKEILVVNSATDRRAVFQDFGSEEAQLIRTDLQLSLEGKRASCPKTIVETEKDNIFKVVLAEMRVLRFLGILPSQPELPDEINDTNIMNIYSQFLHGYFTISVTSGKTHATAIRVDNCIQKMKSFASLVQNNFLLASINSAEEQHKEHLLSVEAPHFYRWLHRRLESLNFSFRGDISHNNLSTIFLALLKNQHIHQAKDPNYAAQIGQVITQIENFVGALPHENLQTSLLDAHRQHFIKLAGNQSGLRPNDLQHYSKRIVDLQKNGIFKPSQVATWKNTPSPDARWNQLLRLVDLKLDSYRHSRFKSADRVTLLNGLITACGLLNVNNFSSLLNLIRDARASALMNDKSAKYYFFERNYRSHRFVDMLDDIHATVIGFMNPNELDAQVDKEWGVLLTIIEKYNEGKPADQQCALTQNNELSEIKSYFEDRRTQSVENRNYADYITAQVEQITLVQGQIISPQAPRNS